MRIKSKVPYLKRRIRRNQAAFLKLERAVSEEKDLRKRCELAYEAANFAVNHTTDIFSSEILENAFLELAQRQTMPLPDSFEEKTVLHVLTEAYPFGGHTRCAERWIAQFPEYRHSCVLLAQKTEIPSKLQCLVKESGGELIVYPIDSMLARAVALRKYASRFEYTVLYTHMNDPIPLIAFGTPEFQRPVVYFNHADHAFWLGVSIADRVADLAAARRQISAEKRGASGIFTLGIPSETGSFSLPDKADARKKIGIPDGATVIFSSGNAAKFYPLESPCFYDIVSDLLCALPHALYCIAGVDGEHNFWPELKRRFPDRVFYPGRLDYASEYPLYLSAADLVIDSYPVLGGTALIDAVRAGKPVLSLNPLLQSDFLLKSESSCRSYPELIQKARRALQSPEYAAQLQLDVYAHWQQQDTPEAWRSRCEAMLDGLPEKHTVHPFRRLGCSAEISDLSVLTSIWTEPVHPWRELRHRIIQLRLRRGERKISLFGVCLYWKKKRDYKIF